MVEPRQLVTEDPGSAEAAPSLVSACLNACSRRDTCCCLCMRFVSWTGAVDRGSKQKLLSWLPETLLDRAGGANGSCEGAWRGLVVH